MNSYSNRTVFWLFMVIAFAVFFWLRDSGLMRSKPAPETWDLMQLEHWRCKLQKQAGCIFHGAGLRFSLRSADRKTDKLVLEIRVPEKLGIREVRLRVMTDLHKHPEQELRFTKKTAETWRLVLPGAVYRLSPKKALVLWLLKKPRIVQTILVREI